MIKKPITKFFYCLSMLFLISQPHHATDQKEDIGLNTSQMAFLQTIRGENIYGYMKRSKKESLDQQIVFKLENQMFYFQGYEKLDTSIFSFNFKFKDGIQHIQVCLRPGFIDPVDAHYRVSPIEGGKPLKIIFKGSDTKDFVEELFADILADNLIHDDMYYSLCYKVLNIKNSDHFNFVAKYPDLYRKLVSDEDDSDYKNGCHLCDAKKYDQALESFKKSLAQNNVEACYCIGRMYCQGVATGQHDYETGLKYLTLAAINDDAQAQFLLGIIYQDIKINDVQYDFEKGFSWIFMAALQGHQAAVKYAHEFYQEFLPQEDLFASFGGLHL